MNEGKAPAEILNLSSLTELKNLCDEALPCRFLLDGKLVEITLRRLSPALEEQRRTLIRNARATAPFVKDRGEYDMMNPAYLKATDEAERTARSLIVYGCCPMIAAQRPNLIAPIEIHKFITELGLPEMLLDIVASSAMVSGFNVEVVKRANFTSPPGSES